MKRIINLLVTVAMVTTLSTTAFAEDSVNDFNYDEMDTIEYEEIIDDTYDSDEVIDDIVENSEEYVYNEDNLKVSFDKESSEVGLEICNEPYISLSYENQNIESSDKGSDGTIFYESENEDVTSAMQVLDKEDSIVSFRDILNIESYKNKNDFRYHIDIPDYCRLVYGKEYNTFSNKEESVDDNEIIVVNENNELYSKVDKPWAYDDNNNSLKTFYLIDGKDIIQHIDMNENTAYPVIADPVLKVIGKYALRLLYKNIVCKCSPYFPWSSALLNHSIADHPTNIVYYNGSALSNYIKRSAKYYYRVKDVNKYVKKHEKNVKRIYKKTSAGMNFDAFPDTDLYLGFHIMDMYIDANKVKAGNKYKWNITLIMKDKYDFNYWDYSRVVCGNKILGKVVSAVNNFGYLGQRYKALTPYNATVYCSYSIGA